MQLGLLLVVVVLSARLIGIQQARKWCLPGLQHAKEAKKYGIVDDVVPHGVLLKVAEQFALKRKPERSAAKSVMDKGLENRPAVLRCSKSAKRHLQNQR